MENQNVLGTEFKAFTEANVSQEIGSYTMSKKTILNCFALEHSAFEIKHLKA